MDISSEKLKPIGEAPTVESEPAKELAVPSEKSVEQINSTAATTVVFTPSDSVSPIIPADKSAMERAIDRVLEEDLGVIFWSMPEDDRQKFRESGEVAAAKIKTLLEQAAVKAIEIFNVIVAWLKTLPGVNSFFIEQEAKLKTDKIMKLKP